MCRSGSIFFTKFRTENDDQDETEPALPKDEDYDTDLEIEGNFDFYSSF